jgi:uncharacterized membrane protein
LDLHPFIVHFPISLLIVGAICDAVGILWRKDTFLRTGFLLVALGAVAAIAAAVSGDAASEIAFRIPNITEDLEQHEDLSTIVALLSAILVLLRTHLTLKSKFAGPVRKVYLVLILLLASLTAVSGYTGGNIVYNYGAGTLRVKSEIHRADSLEE